MSFRRPIILTAVLLILGFGYLAPIPSLGSPAKTEHTEPPLPGKNSISNLKVRKSDVGLWEASFDYYYTGEPQFVHVIVELPSEGGAPLPWQISRLPTVGRGAHSATINIPYPGSAGVTRQVFVKMYDLTKLGRSDGGVVASVVLDQEIDWPSWSNLSRDKQFATQSPQQNLERAIEWIDGGQHEDLEEAKALLERLVNENPALVQAYIELARIAMKTNWGPDGLRHAESLLASARQLEPDNTNAKILMGYVYTHQKRYQEAEILFAEAAATNPPNLWLWANWGELLAVQGRTDQSIAKYRQAIARPKTRDTYDYARGEAYRRLLLLLEQNKDLDGMEQIYKASVADYGTDSCFPALYAKFLLEHRHDTASAISMSRKALGATCQRDEARQVLGLAQYVVWARSDGAASAEALAQARIYLPPGPMPFYLLCRSDKTVDVAAKLMAAGEKIDQLDKHRLNALAHAVQDDELDTARRLLRLGAKPDTPVTYNDMPVALKPVISGNLEMVKLMQQFGADYSKLTYQGATAFDFAKQTGDTELSELLSRKPQTL